MRQQCAWGGETAGRPVLWSGAEERVLGDRSGGNLGPDGRPSAGVAQFLKKVQAQILTPLMFFFFLPTPFCLAKQ